MFEKYFIEPLSEKKHINSVIYKRFLNFMKQIQKSSKKLPKKLLELIRNDVSSVTGSNLRNIMLVTGKSRIEDLEPEDACNIKYYPVEDENKWKIEVARELLEVQYGSLNLDNFGKDDIKNMIRIVCTM